MKLFMIILLAGQVIDYFDIQKMHPGMSPDTCAIVSGVIQAQLQDSPEFLKQLDVPPEAIEVKCIMADKPPLKKTPLPPLQ